MASAASKLGLASTVRLVTPIALGSVGYAAWHVDWRVAVHSFLTGPGRSSRILLLLFVVFNWKNLPLAWTYRVFYAIVYHSAWRKAPQLSPRALFKPMISETRAPLLEIDYNLHKSNSTYFIDLDVSRTHLVSFLCRPALRQLAHNARTRLVLDDAGKPVAGAMTIALGAVGCSFKREIAAYKSYQLWSRVLSWDRKWLYMVTHFVPKGAARSTHWLDPRLGRVATRRPGSGDNSSAAPEGGREAKMHATAVSKYVFKLGRLTVHPAVVLAASGLLPDRPGGWTSGDGRRGRRRPFRRRRLGLAPRRGPAAQGHAAGQPVPGPRRHARPLRRRRQRRAGQLRALLVGRTSVSAASERPAFTGTGYNEYIDRQMRP